MTKYRLKDQELQKKLDEISDGDFSRQIEGNLQNIKGRGTTDADYRLFFGELPGRYEIVNRFSMLLYEHEIEVFEEYDPHDWNVFPNVTPPEGVMMRCIIKTPGRNLDGPEPELPKICARTSGVWDGRRWQFFGYGSLCEGSTVEYRTWE
jgi:hypothetical protein|nr:MAG TPA: hypothetical protein [Caudoviricetes sp.]